VATLQLENVEDLLAPLGLVSSSSSSASSNTGGSNPLLGLVAVLISCACAGFACVYFEYMVFSIVRCFTCKFI
jgi:hypothetical protein